MKKIKIMAIFLLNMAIASAFEGEAKWSVMAKYDNKVPENIKLDEKYTGGHPSVLDYVFVRTRTANLRETPFTDGKLIKQYSYDVKLKLIEKVLANENVWFYVEDANGVKGYVSSAHVTRRNFRFQMALDKINYIENFIKNAEENGKEIVSNNAYVPNPTNTGLRREKDKYGTTLDQSSIAKSVATGEEIYIPDRSIISVLERGQNESKIRVANIKEELIIPNNLLASTPKVKSDFNKVIAIDTQNQNMMVFEKENNEWKVISYVYSKTGIVSALGFETPKGYYVSAMAKYLMPYNDENGEKQGYARYAIRFSGGGYLHGTPINYEEEMNKEFFMKQKEKTLGTFTGTRKCIRTTEEHAEFLFNWFIKEPNKNSNFQNITQNLLFVIF